MDLDILKIDLKGLADGLNSFEFDLADAYFKAVNAPEVGRGNVHVSLKIVRTITSHSISTKKERLYCRATSAWTIWSNLSRHNSVLKLSLETHTQKTATLLQYLRTKEYLMFHGSSTNLYFLLCLSSMCMHLENATQL